MSNPGPDDRWLKWDAGEKHELTIRSAHAQQLRVHWTGSGYEACTGPSCPLCQYGNKAKTRWSVAVTCQGMDLTWEMANLTYQDLMAIAAAYGGITDLRMQVSRRGEGRATRYTIVPLSHVQDREPEASPQTLKEYIAEMCKLAGLDMQKELNLWLDTNGQHLAELPLAEKLSLFSEWIEKKTEQLTDEPEPEPEPSLADFLA